jgi:hypothetical protein
MTVKVDRYTKVMLTVIAVLLGMVAVGLWCETPTMMPSAQAGIPDSGAQLDKLILKVAAIEGEIREMKALLVSGRVKVQLVETKAAKKSSPK